MNKHRTVTLIASVGFLLLAMFALSVYLSRPGIPPTTLSDTFGVAEEGEYLARIAGCIACHTDAKQGGAPLAGGAAIETPFGRFYAPNITPDKIFGIGSWSLTEFYTALTSGVSPSGGHYYPAFPYNSYASLSLSDIADIKAYLDSALPVQTLSTPHELMWPFSFRPLMIAWKALFFDDSVSLDAGTARTNRGDYLVRGLGHCAECHSQRSVFGALTSKQYLGGNTRGPEGHSVPALAGSDAEVQQWQATDLVFYLQTGLRPDGDVAGGSMADVIDEVTAHLRQDDAQAIADYLLSLP